VAKRIPIIVALRPKHWIKNLLIFALPFSDGLVVGSRFDIDAVIRGCILFVSLSAASSANYILNDIRDLNQDRQHPTKKDRPFASGKISIRYGVLVSVGLFTLSLGSSLFVSGAWTFLLIFTVLQSLYTLVFKHLSGYDVVMLALLYVLRAVMPASYEEIPLSKWYLVIFFTGALFLATGKRYAEIRYSGEEITRKVLTSYSEIQLLLWVGVSLALFITSYLSWIFTFTSDSSFLLLLASIIPMCIILIRVSSLILSRDGEDPTKLIFRQKDNFFLVSVWLVIYLAGKGLL
jgi:decaprenyl-phosphate phosphoribosyltransferase